MATRFQPSSLRRFALRTHKTPGLKARLFSVLVIAGLLQLTCPWSVIAVTQQSRLPKRIEAWRKQSPKADAPRPLKLPASRAFKLENGLSVVLIEDHRAPVVTIAVGIPIATSSSKDIAELTNRMALAEATAELITEGAGSRTSEQLAREVETLGGRLASSASDDYAEVTASVVSENAERMIELLGDVLLHPAFPETEVSLYKRNRIQNLVVRRQDPSFLAGEQFDRVVYGLHPYAISAPTPASVDALTREKIVHFYNSEFSPSGAVGVIVGDFDVSKIDMKTREALAHWKGPPKRINARQVSSDVAKPTGTRVFLVNRPGSAQADFRVGALAVKRSDAGYFPLLVVNAILGAGTNSRLFLNIRERLGYAYDVFSSLEALREGGTFFGGGESRTEVAVPAIKEMLQEFNRLSTTKVEPQELQAAKNYLNGLFSLALSTQSGIAERTLQTYMLNLENDYLETYRSRIDAVTAEQVQEAAGRCFGSGPRTIVAVGDASKLAETLKGIGPVDVLDTEGNPVRAPGR